MMTMACILIFTSYIVISFLFRHYRTVCFLFYLLKAIQRLSNNDEDLITQLCDSMSKVFHSGNDFINMEEKINNFRRKEVETELLLNSSREGKYNISMNSRDFIR